MSLGYGHLARVGHLYPSGGLADYEIQLMAPAGVQFVTTRLPFSGTGIDDDLHLFDDIEFHAQLVADAHVSLIAVNCTAATMLAGAESIHRRVLNATNLESITTMEAVLAALRACGIARLALLTPYPDDLVTAEVDFLAANGLEVVHSTNVPCHTPREQAEIQPSAWLELVRAMPSVRSIRADGLLMSCAGARVAPVLNEIEMWLDAPVVASNQALLWRVLHALGESARPTGYGSLLAGQYD